MNKVIAIGIDAAEPGLIEEWITDGSLKNLATLKQGGFYTRLHSSADWLAGSPWPTFYTGSNPGEHGFYHYLQWRGEKMDYARPDEDWIEATPFWRKFGGKLKIIESDVPLTFPPSPVNGTIISNWASHDRIHPPVTYPKEKLAWLYKEFGEPPINEEVGGLQEFSDLMQLKTELILANEKEAELAAVLLQEEEWDFFICCFTSAHRAGHKFWDTTNIKGELSEEQIVKFRNALKEIYISCDESIGCILDQIPEEVTVMIFSLHGMGVNTTLSDQVLPEMISRVLKGEREASGKNKKGVIKTLRNLIPLKWRSHARQWLPVEWQDKMTAYWRMAGTDWSKTKTFSLLADYQGYIRINLKGREKEGIVEPGIEYNDLCEQLMSGLQTFCDEQSGEPVIQSISRKDQIFEKGHGFHHLPDLIVNWRYVPVVNYRTIQSREFGEIKWPFPGKNPDGRSGNHRPEGFLLMKRGNHGYDTDIQVQHISDLKALICEELGIYEQ